MMKPAAALFLTGGKTFGLKYSSFNNDNLVLNHIKGILRRKADAAFGAVRFCQPGGLESFRYRLAGYNQEGIGHIADQAVARQDPQGHVFVKRAEYFAAVISAERPRKQAPDIKTLEFK